MIYLRDDQYEALRLSAFEKRVSVSDLVRDLLDVAMGNPSPKVTPPKIEAPTLTRPVLANVKRIRDQDGNRL